MSVVEVGRVGGGPSLSVAVDGAEDGPTVVLLHGVGRSFRSWDFLVSELGASHRLVRPDARGHGGSGRASGTYLLADYVGDVVAVLDEVVSGPVIMIGHSLGAVTAAAVAQQHPHRVRATVLVDPPFQLAEPVDAPPTGPLIEMFRGIQRRSPEWRRDGTTEAALAREIAAAPSPFGVLMGERYALDAITARAHGHLHVDASVFDPLIDPPPGHLGPEVVVDRGVTQPTLVLAADLTAPDRATSRSHEERFVAASDDVTWLRVDGGGHSLHEETDHRGTAVARLRGFLAVVGT